MTSRANQAIAYLDSLSDQQLDDFFKEVVNDIGETPAEDSGTFFWMMGGAVDYFHSAALCDSDRFDTYYADPRGISISAHVNDEATMLVEAPIYGERAPIGEYLYRFEGSADDLDAA